MHWIRVQWTPIAAFHERTHLVWCGVSRWIIWTSRNRRWSYRELSRIYSRRGCGYQLSWNPILRRLLWNDWRRGMHNSISERSAVDLSNFRGILNCQLRSRSVDTSLITIFCDSVLITACALVQETQSSRKMITTNTTAITMPIIAPVSILNLTT